MAAETGAAVVGVDVSDVGITSARTRAEELGLTDRARFEVADVTSTGLENRSLDAAMSVDTIWAIPDKVALLRETARILKDGARFVFTNWDWERSPPGALPPVNDHRPLLQQAGFEIESYDIQPSEDKRRAYYERAVAAESALLDELGEEETQKILYEPRGWLGLIDGTNYFPYTRRIFVVARRRPR
jgi:ubiquinone/menaquinone biosynthesis C-methylase UbiE